MEVIEQHRTRAQCPNQVQKRGSRSGIPRFHFLRIKLKPSRIGRTRTSTLGSFAMAVLKRCILFASLRARRLRRNDSSTSSSAGVYSTAPPPAAASSTRPFHSTLSTTTIPPRRKRRSVERKASIYSTNRVLSASRNTMSKGSATSSGVDDSNDANASVTFHNSQVEPSR